ncbi:MAG: hypothetical protein ACPGWM_07650, partial [Flavobacteriales bacterium]
IARRIIKTSFDYAVSIIAHFSKMDRYHEKLSELRKLDRGTLGKAIANCLDEHDLDLVPMFESHDLKHVLLEYNMTPEGEIRLQAFMIGNGNYSIPSFAIFFFGAFLLPDLWPTFYGDFSKGRNTIPLANWTIENYAQHNLNDLKSQLMQERRTNLNPTTGVSFIRLAALSVVFAGGFGMFFCLPFLFSSNLADLVGAGFPFVGGAILVAGGLFTLSNLSKGAGHHDLKRQIVD